MSKKCKVGGRPWLNCRSQDAETILLRAYGTQRYDEMVTEYLRDPPPDPEQSWTKWLMHLAITRLEYSDVQRELFG